MNEPRQVTPYESLVQIFRSAKFQDDLRAQLPKEIEPDKFTTTLIAALRENPDLIECNRSTLYNAVQEAAAEGLMPDGNDGVINVYNVKVSKNPERWEKHAQWQRMVGGVVKLFALAGINAYAVSVHANDKIEAWYDGTGQHIRIDPVLFGERGNRVGAVAVAKMADGTTRFEAMNEDDLKRARAASKSANSGPWVNWPERMEQKSVLHRLSRRVAFIDPVAAAKLRKLNDEFADDGSPTGAPAVSLSVGRPSALQAALAAPQPAGIELPGANIAREAEPDLVPADVMADSAAPQAKDII